MWDEPYLESCCRSALHRLILAGDAGRPDGLKDGPCLARLRAMGLAAQAGEGRIVASAPGMARHEREILTRTCVSRPGSLGGRSTRGPA